MTGPEAIEHGTAAHVGADPCASPGHPCEQCPGLRAPKALLLEPTRD